MAYTGLNHERIKYSNRNAILKLLNDHGQLSRKDLAAALDLTTASVTNICSAELANGFLKELGEVHEEEKRAGRKKINLEINYDRFSVVSVAIEQETTHITVSNMRGENAARTRLKTPESDNYEAFLPRVAQKCLALLEKEGIPKSAVLGVGITIPGYVVREDGDIVVRSEQVVHVKQEMEKLLGMTVVVENNIKAFAEAELIFANGKSHDNLMFVKWGPGVGAAFVINKQIYVSTDHKEAELGHIIVDPKGPRCRCGKRGCFETLVSTHALSDAVREKCTKKSMPKLCALAKNDPKNITAHNIQNWIRCDEAAMWEILEKKIGLMARTVTNLQTLIAPDRTILYGNIFSLPKIMDKFYAACREYDPDYDASRVVCSELYDKMSYIGPLAIAVNELFLSGNLA